MRRHILLALALLSLVKITTSSIGHLSTLETMSSFKTTADLLGDLDSEIDDFERQASTLTKDNSVIGRIFGMAHDYAKSIGSIYYNTHSNIDIVTNYYLYDIYYNQMEIREKYKLPN